MILRDVCGASFTKNKSLLRHVRTVHQGMKRTDNETRKRDVTDNEAGKQGLLAGLYSETFGESVESDPQAAFKSPAEYVMMAMKAHIGHLMSLCRQLNSLTLNMTPSGLLYTRGLIFMCMLLMILEYLSILNVPSIVRYQV